eukprot:scaffold2846_cov102-Skeletonema_menzelii.AAC.1
MESGVTLADLRKEENLETNTRSLSCCVQFIYLLRRLCESDGDLLTVAVLEVGELVNTHGGTQREVT